VAFGLVTEDNHSWPPFAADVLIELWRRDAPATSGSAAGKPEYFVNVLYLGKVGYTS
jgi:hypothetical protein